MFDEFYVRLPWEKLGSESVFFLEKGIRPEIYLSNRTVQQVSESDAAAAEKIVSAFGASTIHAPFIDISPGALDEEVRAISFAKMEKTVRIARRLRSRLVVMHYNYDPVYYRQDFPAWIRRSADFFRRLLPPGDPVMLALENVADPSPFIGGQLVSAIADPRVVHCVDIGHHHLFGEVNLDDWMLYLAPQEHIHFHFHDNDGSEDDHLPLGRGTIDWPKTRGIIERLQLPFSVGLEPHSSEDRLATLASYKKFFL